MIRLQRGRNGLALPARRRPRLPGVEPMEPRVLLATWTVQNLADDGSVSTLRWAIAEVNSDSGRPRSTFNLPGSGVQVITLTSPLPEITQPVVIDGTTQPGYSGTDLIQIDGSKAGAHCDGLVLSGGASVVRGLIISGFSGAGIVLDGSGSNLVTGNQIGTDPTGTHAQPNTEGIKVLGSSLNTIGGTMAGAGNLISGNQGNGIEIVRSSEDATGNAILGNLIGTTADGQQALPNQGDGLLINGADSNQVGDSVPGAANVLSGNLQNGIEITSAATGNSILGNLVGTTADGKHPLGNQADGVRLDGATQSTVGGVNPGEGNVDLEQPGEWCRDRSLGRQQPS